ncbi:hypothetical protein WJX74_006850 [Apatococcus lobatus]|uniref:Large ribosomal subunit protein bL25 L25 domain-containing protein n=1 Tax=Apatococcus lobatus TaxID=904363 RepID=A0AAW1REL3_9CHLO
MRRALIPAVHSIRFSGTNTFASLTSATPQEGVEDLDIQLRAKAGTHHSTKLRKLGKTPGTLFSLPNNNTKLIWFDSKDIAAKIRVFGRKGLCSRIFNLHLSNADQTATEIFPALPKIVHVNSVSDIVENVNFMYAPEERFISAKIPVQVTGHEISPAVKGGGYPNTIRKTIHLRCEVSKVPTPSGTARSSGAQDDSRERWQQGLMCSFVGHEPAGACPTVPYARS